MRCKCLQISSSHESRSWNLKNEKGLRLAALIGLCSVFGWFSQKEEIERDNVMTFTYDLYRFHREHMKMEGRLSNYIHRAIRRMIKSFKLPRDAFYYSIIDQFHLDSSIRNKREPLNGYWLSRPFGV